MIMKTNLVMLVNSHLPNVWYFPSCAQSLTLVKIRLDMSDVVFFFFFFFFLFFFFLGGGGGDIGILCQL